MHQKQNTLQVKSENFWGGRDWPLTDSWFYECAAIANDAQTASWLAPSSTSKTLQHCRLGARNLRNHRMALT